MTPEYPSVYIDNLSKEFKAVANRNDATAMEKYMKGISLFYGIKAPVRRQVSSEFIRNNGKPGSEEFEELIMQCWEHDRREIQYFGMELVMRCKKIWHKDHLKLFEHMITQKSWWDTVDFIASNIIGHYFNMFPENVHTVIWQWNSSDNMWLNRTSILFQLKYKNETDNDLLFKCIETHLESGEFFLRKAIGWALRELSKTDPGAVQEFIDSHSLSPLSLREASKYL